MQEFQPNQSGGRKYFRIYCCKAKMSFTIQCENLPHGAPEAVDVLDESDRLLATDSVAIALGCHPDEILDFDLQPSAHVVYFRLLETPEDVLALLAARHDAGEQVTCVHAKSDRGRAAFEVIFGEHEDAAVRGGPGIAVRAGAALCAAGAAVRAGANTAREHVESFTATYDKQTGVAEVVATFKTPGGKLRLSASSSDGVDIDFASNEEGDGKKDSVNDKEAKSDGTKSKP